jgi:Domain of unknown function (DUF2019)
VALESIPTPELVTRFADAAKRHDEALLETNQGLANDWAAEIWEIAGELRRRDDSSALLSLLDDDDPDVRFNAATCALHFAPERAEPVLVALTDIPVRASLDAETMLDLWRQGRLPSP